MVDANNDAVAGKVKFGDFPFPLTKGPKESRYLTWLRNHSNYMATRGFLDYLRIAGVMVRGIVINFSIILSLLLFVSLVIGHLYRLDLRSVTILSADLKLPFNQLTSLKKQDERPIDKWLKSHISEKTIQALIDVSPQRKDLLSKEFRVLIDGTLIYDYERFSGVELSPETEYFLRTDIDPYIANPQGAALRRLNRLLLQDAYPIELGRKKPPEDTFWVWVKSPRMPDPFAATILVLVISLVCIGLSPIWIVAGEIRGHKKSTERAGSDSSVKRRDRFERYFGGALLVIFAVALLEALPVLVEKLHQFLMIPETNWNTYFASAAGVSIAVMGGAGKLLSVLGGAKKKLAMLLIGLLGLLAPLLVILYVTEWLIYHPTYEGWLKFILWVVPALFFLLILGVMFVGAIKRRFKFLQQVKLAGLAAAWVIIAIFALFFQLLNWVEGTALESVGDQSNFYFVFMSMVELLFFCRLVVDVNRTSIHGLYRDRLASAYLVGVDTKGDVDIEEDINLVEIGCHEAGSTAPYQLINATLNLQGSKDISIRDRASDFFIFSKRFIGGERTGYCRSATLEYVHPQMSLATAMAISAAAASPNMGRGTSPLLVAFMVMLNIRLGYWLPNPGLLEKKLGGSSLRQIRKEREATKKPPGFSFSDVFEQELVEIEKRWNNVYPNPSERKQRKLNLTNRKTTTTPTTEHGLVGIGFSGGGIRSATINLGITQALHERGVFDHVDYMSTVSGGGYLGSSLSTLMRWRGLSDVAGTLSVSRDDATGDTIVRVSRTQTEVCEREYRYPNKSELFVTDGERIKAGQPLIKEPGPQIYSEIEGVVSFHTNASGEKIVRVSDREREYRYSNFVKLDDALMDGGEVKAGQRLVKILGSHFCSDIDGKVSLHTNAMGEKIVKITGWSAPSEQHEYRFSRLDTPVVKTGDHVKAGQVLIERHSSLWDRFNWRVRPWALVREMMMKLDETNKWVNLSDGGHIENLAGIELLRRRCKFIIIGDGESDPEFSFNGLATLIRYARIDLGITIDIHPDAIRVDKTKDAVDKGTDNISAKHWAFGTITYPPNEDNGYKREEGYLLYLKSSYTGDEDEVIKEYRHRKPSFPHESTADQFFDEDQFECYRALGQHIAEKALKHVPDPSDGKLSFSQMGGWFTKGLRDKAKAKKQSAANS